MSTSILKGIILIFLTGLSTLLNAQTLPWQRINPIPFECTIADAQVLNNGRIVGVGNGSTVVYSDNFGDDWTIVYRPANAPFLTNLTSVCFIDDNSGWACGSSKTIIQTSDGGFSWTLIHQNTAYPSSRKYSDIEFLNETEGFVIIDAFLDTLLKTYDGGMNWVMLAGLENYNFTQIEFITPEIGFLYGGGGYILKTMDAGLSWEEIAVADTIDNLSINTMYFLDQQTGFIGATAYSMVDHDHYMLKTEDQGNSWQITSREYDFEAKSIAFSNADTGYTVGYVPWYRNNIMRTVDGGDHWELVSDTIGYWGLDNFCTDNVGKVMLIGHKGQVFNSYDYGANWVKSFSNPFFGFDALSSVILDDSSIIISGEGGTGGVPWYRNIISYDRGGSWAKTEDYYGIVNDLYYVNDSVGFYCGGYGYSGEQNYVYKTTNGGLDWNNTELSDDDAILTKIEFINDSTGFLGGLSDNYGYFILYKTIDQGENWDEVNIGYYAEGEAAEFDFYNDSSAIITGYIHPPNGQIIRTNDQGETWYIDSLPFDSYFTHVHFMNPDTGILIGINKICKTVDGGDSWYQVDFEYDEHVYPELSYEFLENGTGFLYLRGNADWMFKTEDYGDTWLEIERPTTSEISSISFFSPDEGIIAGEKSIIFKTYTGGLVSLPEWPSEKDEEEHLLIYPNPVQSKIFVDIPKGYENGILRIYDLQGRLISYYTNLNAGEISADINIPDGIYIVTIENNFSRLSGKLIVMD